MYKVLTVQAGCCGNVNPRSIEKIANDMAEDGYTLVVAYEADVGCCCRSKAAILVFKR